MLFFTCAILHVKRTLINRLIMLISFCMTFRELLKKHNIKQLDIAYKLKCDTSNLRKYDNLLDRSIKEVMLIHELTNIPYKELIGTELKD